MPYTVHLTAMSSTPQKKTCIVIAGPTAVGKTSVAIALAQHFSTAIISADSRQCYKELDIGVAKPSPEQLQLVKHYFINSHSIADEVNAGMFERYALEATKTIFADNDVAILVGGTGLYTRAFCGGMDAIPSVATAVREAISKNYQAKGINWLQEEIKLKDPAWYAGGEIQNPQRMMRALEVMEATGRSIRSFQQASIQSRAFNIIKIGLTMPRAELYTNINRRVDAMVEQGLEAEVRGVLPWRHLNALQTVGYSELFTYFDGLLDLPTAIDQIKQHTRHYAKRQLTWFLKDQAFEWFSPLDYSQLIKYLRNLV